VRAEHIVILAAALDIVAALLVIAHYSELALEKKSPLRARPS
jgi:hypothetical protein